MSLDVRLKITSDVSGAKSGIESLDKDAAKLERSFDSVKSSAAKSGDSISKMGVEGAAKVALVSKQGAVLDQRLGAVTTKAGLARAAIGKMGAAGVASLTLMNGSLATSVKYLGLLGAPIAVGGLAVMTSSVMAAHKELSIMTETLGVNRSALEAWGAAGATVGVSGEKVGDILKDVSDKIGDFASSGGGEAKDIFERLNVNVKELVNLAPDQVLLKIAAAMDEVSDISQSEKIFLLESLANDSSRLIPLLDDNAKRLRDIEVAARSVGAIMSPQQIATLDEAKAKMSGIKQGLTGVRNEVGVLGATFVNAFEGEINGAIAGFRGQLAVMPANFDVIRKAWNFSFESQNAASPPS